ncbi:MAG: TIGR04282 family arsenosugar biosynthesis glycosyltransferase [Acidobacteria bacterium]|nr:TIGR04282 family arsenosugar biosynthesis glycosyltransferase [Acidobacteriota bacterium]
MKRVNRISALHERPALLVFAKAPVPGTVKTRLCPPLTPKNAALLYRAMLRDTTRIAGASGCDTFFCYSPRGSKAMLRRVIGDQQFIWQGTGDLGARLARCFQRALGVGYRKVIAIGADSPTLPVERITAAARELDRADLVVGPAVDGGYYLIGLSRWAPDVFRAIPWSTGDVLSRTIARARTRRIRWSVLDPLHDVDQPSDLLIVISEIRKGLDIPHTEKALARCGLFNTR